MIKRETKLKDDANKIDILVSGNVANLSTSDDDEVDEDIDNSDETLLLEKDSKRANPKTKKAADALTFAVINKRYELLGLAGQGGMASVYKAKDLKDNREVAVKVLDRDLANMDSVLERFQKEVSAASAMAHENLAAVYDSGVTEDGRPYIVMEYMRGQTLAQLLKKRAKLSLNEFADIFAQVAKGLAHAHRRGVVHRDIKPSNIFLYTDAKGKLGVKLLDFGIAKSLADIDETSLHLTHTGQVLGSPFYMSPEQCRALPVDTRSDIYSLGCVMFEAITGSVPFRGETALDTLYKHIHEPAPKVRSNVPKLKPAEILSSTIETALMKQPEARYHTARELAKDLAKLTSWDDLPQELEFDTEPRKTEPIKEKSRFSVTGIAITTAIGLSMLVCGTMLQNNSQGPSINTPLLQTADTSLHLNELWMLSEKSFEDQHYSDAAKYAQMAASITSKNPTSLQHAITLIKSAMGLYAAQTTEAQLDEPRPGATVAEEQLRQGLKIINQYLDKNGARTPLDIIDTLNLCKIPDMNRYYFEGNGQLATMLADGYKPQSEEAKSLFKKVYDLFEERNEITNYPEQEAKNYLQSLANLYFADKQYVDAAKVQSEISDTWNERLIGRTPIVSDGPSFVGDWNSPYHKTESNIHINLKQTGPTVSGTITIGVFPSRTLWKGTINGIADGATASTTFEASGTAADNTGDGGRPQLKNGTVKGELSLTRYDNFLVARIYNYSTIGPQDIALPYSDVLERKPTKNSEKQK